MAAVGVMALGVQAPSAVASTVEGVGSNFDFIAGDGEVNHVTMTRSGGDLIVTDTAGITDNSASCAQDNPNQLSCDRTGTNANSTFDVSLGDLNDELTVNSSTPEAPGLLVSAGAGDDRVDLTGLAVRVPGPISGITADVQGDEGNDTITGSQGTNFLDFCCRFNPPHTGYDAGNDTLVGGPDNDWIQGGRGSDFLDGRGGPDILEGRITDAINPSDPFSQKHYLDDNAVDTIFCGGNQPAPPGNAYDVVAAGPSERVGIDCEQIQQEVLCPPGALCDGTPLISTVTNTAATASGATAAARKRRKVVLGRAAEKVRMKGGTTTGVFIKLRKRRVRRALGRRRRMTVTFSQNLDRLKNGRKVGEANRRKRFKMRRR